MSLETGLREQVTDLAYQGRVLEVASAIVGAELSRLTWYGDKRAVWEPTASYFSEPIGMPNIYLVERPAAVRHHPAVVALCAAEFRIGPDDDITGMTADEDNEGQLATASWAVDLITNFARIYCASEHTQGLPATTILPRPRRSETDSGPAREPMRVVDRRRHLFVDGATQQGAFSNAAEQS